MNRRLQIIMPFIFGILIAIGVLIGKLIGSQGSGLPNRSMLVYPQNNKLNTVLDLISSEYVDTIVSL